MLIDIDKWQEIFSTLGKHKLRTALTAFGVFWGIFMLIALLGAGKGLENGANDQFPRVRNTIWIWMQNPTQIAYQGMPVGRWFRFEPSDVDAIQKNVPSVGMIKGQNNVGIWNGSPPYTVHKSKSGSFNIQGAFAGIEDIQALRITEGRSINTADEQQRRKVVIIGERVKNQLLEKGESAIGANLTINGISVQVVGVFESLSNDNKQEDEEKILLPNDTLRYAFNQVGFVGNLIIVPKAGFDAHATESDVKQYLAKIKRVDPNDKGVFGSYNLQNDADKVEGLFAGMKIFSWIVAIGTIAAGAIGVGNIMLIVVKERTREIGLRKALGATPFSIVAMIMQESLFLTAIAGYSGLVVGVMLLQGITTLLNANGKTQMFTNPQVDFSTALIALFVLIVAGVLASILPAAKAAAVNPILALQDE
jgi:putative ABC transport system permease protein